MKCPTRRCSTILFSVFLLMSITSLTVAQNRVRAKIGIQVSSNGSIVRARAEHAIRTGDRLRIFIIPEDDVYIYVVHEDEENITLLNGDGHREIIKKGSIVVYPHYNSYYQVDRWNKKVSITIVCSPIEILEISKIFNSTAISYEKWVLIKNHLIERSRIILFDKPEKPFEIAGDVRGVTKDPFFKNLKVFSGNSLLLKRYEFKVEK